MLVMKGAVQVSSTVWIWEKQLGGRISEVVPIKAVGRVRSTRRVREKQLGGRTGGVGS